MHISMVQSVLQILSGTLNELDGHHHQDKNRDVLCSAIAPWPLTYLKLYYRALTFEDPRKIMVGLSMHAVVKLGGESPPAPPCRRSDGKAEEIAGTGIPLGRRTPRLPGS